MHSTAIIKSWFQVHLLSQMLAGEYVKYCVALNWSGVELAKMTKNMEMQYKSLENFLDLFHFLLITRK